MILYGRQKKTPTAATQPVEMETVRSQPHNVVKNLINRNSRILHLSRRLTTQREYMKHLDEKIKRRQELENIRSLSPKEQE